MQAFVKPLLVSSIDNAPLDERCHIAKPDSKSGEVDFSFCQGYLQQPTVKGIDAGSVRTCRECKFTIYLSMDHIIFMHSLPY